jgi:hypothetical protein
MATGRLQPWRTRARSSAPSVGTAAQRDVNSQIEHTLLIDRAAAAARPDEQAIQDWAAEQRVFVSSVMADYGEYREAVVAAVEALGAEPVCFERFGGRDSDPNEAYLAEVRSSTIYVGLLGARYGRPLADRYSATHQEFREAERSGLRTSVWAQADAEREGPQQSFYEEVRTFEVTGSYTTPADLRTGLEKRLREIAAQDLSPWVKLGGLIFRATEIEERGTTVIVKATVRDDTVIAAVRGLGEGFGRRGMLLSYTDRTMIVEVASVHATTRAGRAVYFELELKASAVGQPTRMTFNGITWVDMTKLAIRVSLFGEENPLGIMHHIAALSNPFPALSRAGVPEEALRPIAHLLLNEVLVVERGIQRITGFQLGRDVGGRRRLRLAWQEPAPYSNTPVPPPVEIEGELLG